MNQKLLGVRQVKSRNHPVDGLEIPGGRANGFISGEIADDRHNEVMRLEVPDEREILLIRKVTSMLAVPIIRRHQTRIGHSVVSAAVTTGSSDDGRRIIRREARVVINGRSEL